ncbi:unnamed protein product [marine sediment metagenome]|uniref:Uncharacterized protein n=1 Tax=marine sediment metagenome TaxID=412755 RepID=X1F4Y4_9ZZZZ
MKIIKNIKLKIDEEEVLRYQGYHRNKAGKTDEMILETTRKEIEQGYCLFEPKGIYSKLMIRNISSEGRINLENGLYLETNNSMINLLRGTSYLAFGLSTVGNSLEDKISEFFTNKEYSRGLALDAVGTVAVRYLSRHVRSIICKEAKEQNLQTTKHFTPGTAEWDISQQKNIFEIIPADKIGVRLTESYMMIPKKSLSWVIGIGKEIIITSKENDSCKTCLAENCPFRKTF